MSREDVIRYIMGTGRKWWTSELLADSYFIWTGREVEPESLERRLRDIGTTWMYRKDRDTGNEVKHYALEERVAA